MTPASCCGRFLDIISLGNVLLDIFDFISDQRCEPGAMFDGCELHIV